MAEKIEVGLIAFTTVGVAVARDRFPDRLESAYVILSFGLLFLAQTLARDVWLLWKQRATPRDSMPAAQCACLESGVGFIPVLAAAIALASGLSRPVEPPAWIWPVGAAATLWLGFALKDYVIEWNPWRIRRDPDHVNVRVLFSRRGRPR